MAQDSSTSDKNLRKSNIGVTSIQNTLIPDTGIPGHESLASAISSDSTSGSRTRSPQFDVGQIRGEELLSNLIHKIGHEVGNPLTAIISLASIIERFHGEIRQNSPTLPPEKISAYATSIGEEAWRITELSERLVMLLSTKPGNIEACDLRRLLDRTVKRLRLRKRGRRFNVVLQIPEDCGAAAVADGEQLQILFSELFSNADGFLSKKPLLDPHGGNNTLAITDVGIPGRLSADEILVEVTENDHEVCVAIENLLPGPCPFALETLCDPFVTEFPDQKHLGIGLTMCLVIAKRFGGRLEFSESKLSSPKAGDVYVFTVRVSLPKDCGQEENDRIR